MSESSNMNRLLWAVVVSLLGSVMILGIFFWYKSFAYYTHSIYTYQLDSITDEPDSEDRQMVVSYERLKRYYETVIANHSSSDIIVEIYDNTDGSAPIQIENDLLLAPGEEYRFHSYEYAYKVIIHGRDIAEDNILVEASTLSYLKEYRQSVIITMIIGIVMVGIWDLLILFIPGVVSKYGTKINVGIALFSAAGSILSCIFIYRGYYESNLCFIALFSTVLALALKKRECYREWKKKTVSTDEIYLAAGVISLFFSCLIMAGMYNSIENTPLYFFNSLNKMSLPDYMITVVVFLLLFLILSCIFQKNSKAVSFIKYYCAGKELFICVPAVIAAFLVQQNEIGFAGNAVNSILCIALTGILFFLLLKYGVNGENSKAKSWPIYILYAFAIIITTISTMAINYFHMGNRTPDYVHHIGWYYKSLYYTVNNLPYPDSEFGLYGHYQLFYKVPMKIFGTNLLTIGFITGIVGGLTAFFAIGIIHMLTKSNLLRAIGVLAVVNILCFRLYLAIVPHRLIFPVIMLFFILYLRKKKNKWYHILLGSIISLLSVVWNTEVGAVVLITWILYLILMAMSGKDYALSKYIKKILVCLGIILVAAIVIGVVIHGLDQSEAAALANIFGVLMNINYMFSAHFNFIRWTNDPWIYIMILYLIMTAYGMSRMGFLGVDRDKSKNMPAVISTAVMGLGLMVYFISRPEDYSIVILPAIFLTIMLLDKYRLKKGQVERTLSIFLLLGLCCILMRTGNVIEEVWSRVVVHQQLNYNLLLEDLDTFSKDVPEGSRVWEDGLTEIYMCLDWNIPPENNTEFFVSSVDTLEDDINYTIIKEILFGDMRYYLYRNNNYSQ